MVTLREERELFPLICRREFGDIMSSKGLNNKMNFFPYPLILYCEGNTKYL